MRAVFGAAFAAVLLAMSGCATKDQFVELTPQVAGQRSPVVESSKVALDVRDIRPRKRLGQIDNLNGEIARIVSGRDLPYTVQLAAASALRDYGFDATLWSDDAQPRLLIEIATIDHRVGAALPRAAETDVSMRATAWSQGQRFNAQAQTSLENTFARPATAAANGEIIEHAIGRTLEKLLNAELAQFLARPQGAVTKGIGG